MRVWLFTLIVLTVFVSGAIAQAPDPAPTADSAQTEKTEEVKEPEVVKEAAAPEEPASIPSTLSLKESAFCTGVEEREPISRETNFGSDIGTIYFWSNVLNDGEESSVEHVWIYNEVEMARVVLPANYPRNRIWSSKTILPIWKGDWTVLVIAESDTLGKQTCTIE